MTQLPTGTVTFLFTDIEGSTAMLQRLGDQYVEVLSTHNRLLRGAFGSGMEVSSDGDAFFFVFSSVTAAARAAIEGQRSLADFPWPSGGNVSVRMGLHTGDGVLGGDNYVGLDVNRAARIAASGHGGQILVSETARSLIAADVADDVSFHDLGRHRFKGIGQPEHVYQLVVDALPAEFPPIRSLSTASTNLPVQPTAFVGRKTEAEQVAGLIAGSRLVTLTGPGGSGKTRLALHVGSSLVGEFDGGVFYVPLEGVNTPDLVMGSIASVVGVSEEEDVPLTAQIATRLGSSPTLLLLDNFEHVIEAASELASLLAESPSTRVLATSQSPLRIRGEQLYPVPPMDQGESVELFLRLVRAGDPGFEPADDEVAVVEEIVHRLENLPLALEIAAPRVRLFGLSDLRSRLVEHLDLELPGQADVPERHRTLRSAIEWSYGLLTPDEQALLRQISVFHGGFTLDAVEAVASTNPGSSVVEGVASLLDKSLLQRRVRHGEARFRLLDPVRKIASGKLEEAGEWLETAQRHAGYFRELAETAQPFLEAEGQDEWARRLEEELDNLRAALEWGRDTGQPDLGLRLIGSAWRFFHRRGHLREARRWLELLAADPDASEDARIVGLHGMAGIAYWQGDRTRALEIYHELLALAEDGTDGLFLADTLYGLATTYGQLGEAEKALEYADKSREAYLAAGSPSGAGRVLGSVAFVAWQSRRLEESLALWEEARRNYEAIGDTVETLQTDIAIAALNHELGRPETAVRAALAALDGMVALGDVSGTIQAIDFLAVLVAPAEPESAVRLASAASKLRGEAGGGLTAEAVGFSPVRSEVEGVLGAQAVDAAWASGEELGLEEAASLGRQTATAALSALDPSGEGQGR